MDSNSVGDGANPFADGEGGRRRPAPCTIVLFGASGDLTQRKLVPALFRMAREGLLPAKLAVVGFARRDKSDDDFRREMLAGVVEHAGVTGEDDPHWRRFASSLFYQRGTFDADEDYAALGERLDGIERELGLPGSRLFYLATAPAWFTPIVRALGRQGLERPRAEAVAGGEPPWVRVVVEKPFGRDLESARALNRDLLGVLEESQIYRIDHYLGKETVQNLLALRFANAIFEPLWNHKYVEQVQITVAESLGVEGRGGYYDGAGALRDMLQNHLMQVLTLVAMEPPAIVEADAIRDEKVKVLRSIRRFAPEDVARSVVRGQYGPATVLGSAVPGYKEEDGVPDDSRTETFVALRLEVNNWRWAGVPFLLRTGKRLAKRATEVYIRFHQPPLQLFGRTAASAATPNALVINIQPDEGISLVFGAKLPGPDIVARPVKMEFRYGTSFGIPTAEAYERLLIDAIVGDSTLFTRRDEVEASWTLMTDVLEAWRSSGQPPCAYPSGSWGPEEADALLEGVSGGWRRL